MRPLYPLVSLLLWSSVICSLAWSQTTQTTQSLDVTAQCAAIGLGQRLCALNTLNAQLWWVDSGGEREAVWVSDYYRLGNWTLSDDGQYVLLEAFGFGGPQHIALLATENFLNQEQPVLPLWQQTYQMIGAANQQSSGQVMGWLDEGLLLRESFGAAVDNAATVGSAEQPGEHCLRWVALPDPGNSRTLCGQAISRLQDAEEAMLLWRRFSPEE